MPDPAPRPMPMEKLERLLGKRRKEFGVQKLTSLLAYILGHRPFEFGLVPDREGFVPLKEVLQAVHEETGWGFVRESHIQEILLSDGRTLFQLEGKRIRAREANWDAPVPCSTEALPKILFLPVRRKAHYAVMDKGLRSPGTRPLVLSRDEEMASRIGRRRDADPVLLHIAAHTACAQGLSFQAFGNLYLVAADIPPAFIVGPAVSRKVMEAPREKEGKKEDFRKKPFPSTPGSFTIDGNEAPEGAGKKKGRKRKGWKEEARKIRKVKRM